MRVTNPNWLRWSLELRIRPDELVRLWMLYREYHEHPVRVSDFLADQRRTVKIMRALAERTRCMSESPNHE